MRYADLLLMAAECEVEIGSLQKAREYVSKVRARASVSPIKNGAINPANHKVLMKVHGQVK
jgi:hypothetical protein